MNVCFRPFERRDAENLFLLDQHCYAPPYGFNYPQLLGTLGARGVSTLVVEREDGEQPSLVGGLMVRDEAWHGEVFIVSLMVEPEVRRLGIGSRLLAWAASTAVHARHRALGTAVERGNAAAAGFLAAQGFQDTGIAQPYFDTLAEGSLWRLNLKQQSQP